MLPLLRYAADGAEHALKEAVSALAEEFRLTEEEKSEYLPSGQQTVIQNRVAWARTYMKKAGLLASPRRGYLAITERGRSVLRENPPAIDVVFLERFPEFIEFKALRHEKEEESPAVPAAPATDIGRTPHEALEAAYDRLRSELVAEILSTIKVSEPALFEEIVVDLLVKMGYGGRERMRDRPSVAAATRALMASLRKIVLGWILSTSKRSGGRLRSAGRRFRSLPVHWMVSVRGRAFLSRLQIFPAMLKITSPVSTRRSSSSMARPWLA
jgi:restriction endonuclease Mrr